MVIEAFPMATFRKGGELWPDWGSCPNSDDERFAELPTAAPVVDAPLANEPKANVVHYHAFAPDPGRATCVMIPRVPPR